MEYVQAGAMILGPLVGALAGTYFGFKGALNGLKESSSRMEDRLNEIRDFTRDTYHYLSKK